MHDLILYPALVFDTETTGLYDFKKAADDPSQPRVCQIAGQLIGPDDQTIDQFEAIIRPDGWTVSDDATEVNGLTTERCHDEGIPIGDAIYGFMALHDQADVLVGYHLNYDTKALRSELRRLGLPDRFGEKLEFCCMWGSRKPGGFKKQPKLVDVVRGLLNREPTAAHTAMGDVTDTVAIYRHLVAIGAAEPKVRKSNK